LEQEKSYDHRSLAPHFKLSIALHFKLNIGQYPTSNEGKQEMKKVHYALGVVSLMYAIVCTRVDIAHTVGTVSRFPSNPSLQHWNVVKWIIDILKVQPI